MLTRILTKCNERHQLHSRTNCDGCSYGVFCPHDCEKCLDYIHNPSHAPTGAPSRKYDCVHMADFYTCKYTCRYTSEIMYALERCKGLHNKENLKVLSFGCGPCTDLFAIDTLRQENTFTYNNIEYRGVDYSQEVWRNIHRDIAEIERPGLEIKFFYQDICNLINTIANGTWVPDLIVFQYVFSDMQKHTDNSAIQEFINTFSDYYNSKIQPHSYVILNDINLGRGYGGGREYFDELMRKLNGSRHRKGRFRNDNRKSESCSGGYPYGNDSDGEFPANTNRFDLNPWRAYSPFDTCGSTQMIIGKVAT